MQNRVLDGLVKEEHTTFTSTSPLLSRFKVKASRDRSSGTKENLHGGSLSEIRWRLFLIRRLRADAYILLWSASREGALLVAMNYGELVDGLAKRIRRIAGADPIFCAGLFCGAGRVRKWFVIDAEAFGASASATSPTPPRRPNST